MISSPSARNMMFTGSVPSTAMIDAKALRKATYGPFAPIAPRPTSAFGCGPIGTSSAPHGS